MKEKKTTKLTKEQKLALLEELLKELVNNIEMKDQLKQLLLKVINEISKEEVTSETKPFWRTVVSGIISFLPSIFKWVKKLIKK
jgi:hypothetical protein